MLALLRKTQPLPVFVNGEPGPAAASAPRSITFRAFLEARQEAAGRAAEKRGDAVARAERRICAELLACLPDGDEDDWADAALARTARCQVDGEGHRAVANLLAGWHIAAGPRPLARAGLLQMSA